MKIFIQQPSIKLLLIIFMGIFVGAVLVACGNTDSGQHMHEKHAHGHETEVEFNKGPHGGRLLESESFVLELSIFETGVPPEFRAWASLNGQPLKPDEVDLTITLTRLNSIKGSKLDEIKFTPHGDALRGDSVIYEPHSFVVTINALHNGVKHNWQYDNFEGRTQIESAVASALEIETSIAGAVVLHETISAFGQITTRPEAVSDIRARFPGIIKSVAVSIGDTVSKGQILATVESNESLNLYSIKAPISGVITQRHGNTGEQTSDQVLFIITDTSTVWVDLSVFPADIHRVKVGASVSIELTNKSPSAELRTIRGKINFINVVAQANQSVSARVIVDNKDGQFLPGSHVKAKIKVAEHAVPLAVKRIGLQAFRDFTVVFAQIGEQYEVRMLALGKQDDEWVEVLDGLEPGTRYVTKNSYVIKADIEKAGAAHDH